MKTDPAQKWLIGLYHSFSENQRKKISTADFQQLKKAQSWLWQALNIYDDFLDGEGEPAQLPQANDNWRRFLAVYYRLPLEISFHYYFNRLCRQLKQANEQEVLSKEIQIKKGQLIIPHQLPSFPRLENLANKSLILSAGPLALLYLSGQGAAAKGLLRFFRFALSAKQLSDDACDWLDDLRQGKISAANLPVIKAAKRNNRRLDIKKEAGTLHLLFAQYSANWLSQQILSLCTSARQEALRLGWASNHQLIVSLILPLEVAARRALSFQNQLLA